MIARPLHDRVLVRREEPVMFSPGGLLIPEPARAFRGEKALVLAVGPGAKNAKGLRKPLLVQVGDTVLLPELCGVEVRVEGELLSLIQESEIVAILDAAEPDSTAS